MKAKIIKTYTIFVLSQMALINLIPKQLNSFFIKVEEVKLSESFYERNVRNNVFTEPLKYMYQQWEM